MIYDENFTKFSPYDFLLVAKKLYGDLDKYDTSLQSAVKRIIISRAYYSIFLALRDYVKENSKDYSPYNSEHAYLISFIRDNNIFDFNINRELTSILFKLKNHRVYCDYKYVKPKSKYSKYWMGDSIKKLLEDCDYVFNVIENS